MKFLSGQPDRTSTFLLGFLAGWFILLIAQCASM